VAEIPVIVDMEVTNRCNAKCYFCPRDATPHQGLMSPEIFEKGFERALAIPESIRVNLCGLGEPLLNRHVPDFVQRVRGAGVECGLSSNGSLLDEKKAAAILEAGLNRIFLNVGDRDDDYEEVYKLPFERTLANVERFVAMAGDDCEVNLVLVNHRRDPEHLADMRRFWQERGVTRFQEFDVINRGGALFVDEMQYQQMPELAEAREMLAEGGGHALCSVPFTSVFVGYDGLYYLCCSDWRKQAPVGSVFDTDIAEAARRKFQHVSTGEPVCKTCNLDPLNRLTDELRGVARGEVTMEDAEAMAADMLRVDQAIHDGLARLDERAGLDAAAQPRRLRTRLRRRIPVRAG
jgi:MoaA/NifB/PqqE/SkfB family radical SAM enzyme